MRKQKKLYCISDEAIESLERLAERSNLNKSVVVEALIMLADEQNLKISIEKKTEYKAEYVKK